MSQVTTPTADNIIDKLQTIAPTHLALVNESMDHAGYFEGKESHFKLTVVSDVFEGKRMVSRHQQVYQLLNELLTAQGGTIHALAIHAYTPTEWEAKEQVPASPNCAGAH